MGVGASSLSLGLPDSSLLGAQRPCTRAHTHTQQLPGGRLTAVRPRPSTGDKSIGSAKLTAEELLPQGPRLRGRRLVSI